MLSLYLQMEGTGSEVGMFAYGCSKSVKSKNITLDLLIRDGVLEPAHNCLSVKYLVSFLLLEKSRTFSLKMCLFKHRDRNL